MQLHQVVLMFDGEVEATNRTDGFDRTVKAVAHMIASTKRAGCYRLTVDGPNVNGSINIDRPRHQHTEADRSPPAGRRSFAQRRHGAG